MAAPASLPAWPLVLANPGALDRHGLRLADLEVVLARAGMPAEAMPLPWPEASGPLRERLAHGGPRLVIAAGGDGTVQATAAMLAGSGLTLGVLPLGTANDFARTLGLPTDLEAAAARLVTGAPRLVDLASVNGRVFLNACHLGLGVETARLVDPRLKRLAGPLAYMAAAGRAWRRAAPFEATLEAPDRAFTVQAAQLLVGNGRYFGGGFQIAPEATLDDGLFDVHLLAWPLSLADAMGWAWALKRGGLRRSQGARHFRTDRLTVRFPAPVSLNMDGEIAELGERLDFSLRRGAIAVLA